MVMHPCGGGGARTFRWIVNLFCHKVPDFPNLLPFRFCVVRRKCSEVELFSVSGGGGLSDQFLPSRPSKSRSPFRGLRRGGAKGPEDHFPISPPLVAPPRALLPSPLRVE